MISEERNRFNSHFSNKKYADLLNNIDSHFDIKIPFRIAESPVFLPETLIEKLKSAGDEIISVIVSEGFKKLSQEAIPASEFVGGDEKNPLFISLDFAVTEEKGELIPQLIELQGFPSLYAYQDFLAKFYKSNYQIHDNLTWFFGDHSSESYPDLLCKAILGTHKAHEVILLDIDPLNQNTYVDFLATREICKISIVGLEDIILEDKKLFYLLNGNKQRVKRIYNRVIFDEMAKRKDLDFSFHLTEDVDVEWAAHPNWFFRISKYIMPFLDSKFVPKTTFLSDFINYPENLEEYVLKPLFSFSGSGVEFNVNKQKLENIQDRGNYILQKKVTYAPVIASPDGGVKTEIRLLYIWEENKSLPTLVTNLCRLSRGEMIGVKYNQDKTWVGASVGFFKPQH